MSLLPSADEATELQLVDGVEANAQVRPASEEVSTGPQADAAMIRVPSAEDAIDRHSALGAAVAVQVIPALVEE